MNGSAVLEPTELSGNKTFTFPNETGTFALGTGSAGKCAQWSTTNTLTAAAAACGGGSSFSYPFPSSATGSPLMLLASTTIGDGTQRGGLTVSGGATTTGNAYFAGNLNIGTTTASALFTAAKSSAANSDVVVLAPASASGNRTLTFTGNSIDSTVTNTGAANGWGFGTNGASVGYGTTNPNYAFAVIKPYGNTNFIFGVGSSTSAGPTPSHTDYFTVNTGSVQVTSNATMQVGGSDNRGVLTVQKSSTAAYAANSDPQDAGRYFVMENTESNQALAGEFANVTLQLAPTLGIGAPGVGNGRVLSDIRAVRQVASSSDMAFVFSAFTNSNGYKDFFQVASSTNWFLGNLKVGGTGAIANVLGVNGGASVGASYLQNAAPTNGLIVSGTTGIGTTSPYAKLSVHANNGDTATTLFAIASSTASATTTLFAVGNDGHVFASTTAPTVSSGSIDGTDTGGRVLGCTTTCTITFSHAYQKVPSCIVKEETESLANAMTITPAVGSLAVAQTSLGTFDFVCRGQ